MKRALGFALFAALGCSEPEPAPWGFEIAPEQGYRLEMHDETVIDSIVVNIERLADVRFRASRDSAGVELELFLDRFYLAVESGQGGRTELAISPKAFASRAADGTELRLEADERTPSGLTVAELLSQPVSGTMVNGRGVAVRSSWHSADPLLGDVEVLGWLLLGLPVSDADKAAWTASREVPRIGRYRLGIEMPLRFERAEGGSELAVTGFVERPEITLADGYRGSIQLELEGRTRLGAAGQVAHSRYLLRMKFEAVDGSVIRSRHRVTIECLGCGDGVQISP
jgi:hypothetical protein